MQIADARHLNASLIARRGDPYAPLHDKRSQCAIRGESEKDGGKLAPKVSAENRGLAN